MDMARRIRINVDDCDGVSFDIKLEGDITKEKLMRVYDMMEMIEEKKTATLDTLGAKIWHVVEKYFTVGNFTSSLIQEKYEDEYNEPIKLSVISTYLSRLEQKTKLERKKTGREWTYTQPRIRA